MLAVVIGTSDIRVPVDHQVSIQIVGIIWIGIFSQSIFQILVYSDDVVDDSVNTEGSFEDGRYIQ